MNSCHQLFTVALLLAFSLLESNQTNAADGGGMLTVGDKAPALDIEHWIQDNDGQLRPVSRFEQGRAYVVEFWGTWCPPCVAIMPHMAKIQHAYGYDALRIVSVSTEGLEDVKTFLPRSVPGMEGMSYDELTRTYSLTADPDQSVYKDYMNAAGISAVPAAFIVGKTGVVEWIGHPGMIDKPLKAVMDGAWDREVFAAEFQAKQSALAAVRRVSRMQQLKRDKPESVLASIDEELKALEHVDAPEVQQLRMFRTRLLGAMNRVNEAEEEVRRSLDASGDDMESVATAAASILTLPPTAADGRSKLVDLAVAKIDAARRAESLDDLPAALRAAGDAKLRLLVVQLYTASGQKEKAVAAARDAVQGAADAETRAAAQAMYDRLQEQMRP